MKVTDYFDYDDKSFDGVIDDPIYSDELDDECDENLSHQFGVCMSMMMISMISSLLYLKIMV